MNERALRRIQLVYAYILSVINGAINGEHNPHSLSIPWTAPHQGTCPGRNTSFQAAALAVESGDNKIIYQDILTALADATYDLSMLCRENLTGANTVPDNSREVKFILGVYEHYFN